MKIMKAIKNKAETMSAELMAAYTTDRKGRKAAFSVGMVLGSIMNAGVIAHAASILEFGQEVASVGADIYKATFAAVTVIAAIFLIFAFIMRMTQNPQRSAQATQWIIRIVVCYVGINVIGLILSIVKDTASTHDGWQYDAG